MRIGTRQPHAVIWSGGSTEVSATPSTAESMTATCWLPDCHEV